MGEGGDGPGFGQGALVRDRELIRERIARAAMERAARSARVRARAAKAEAAEHAREHRG